MSGSNSIEVSVPTDLTVTSDGDSEEGYKSAIASRRHATQIQALVSEKSQLLKQLEKLKLELLSKDAHIEATAAQHEKILAKMNIEKNNLLSSKQMAINRLESENKKSKDDLQTIRERAARELATLAEKCSVFQENQKRLTVKQDTLRSSLQNLTLSSEEYEHLKQIPSDRLSLQQFTSIRVYELVWPLQCKIDELEAINLSLNNVISAKNSQNQSISEELKSLTYNLQKNREKCQEYVHELSLLRNEKSNEDFKIRNFDRIKRERDKFEINLKDLHEKLLTYGVQVTSLTKEKEILNETLVNLKFKLRSLEQSSSYTKGELEDTLSKLEKSETELNSLKQQITLENKKSKEFHDKYLESVEEKMITGLSLKDNAYELNIMKLKIEEISNIEKDLKAKLEDKMLRLEEAESEAKEYKMKYKVEKEMVENELREMRTNISTINKSRDKLLKENTEMLKEIQSVKQQLNQENIKHNQDMSTLTQQLDRAKNILLKYESLEEEFNNSIRMAATVPGETSASVIERLFPGISFHGYKSVEKNIVLTKKVLKLERDNIEACKTIKKLTEGLMRLRTTLASYKYVLNKTSEPSKNLLEQIAKQKDQIQALQRALDLNSSNNEKINKDHTEIKKDLLKMRHNIIDIDRDNNEIRELKMKLQNML